MANVIFTGTGANVGWGTNTVNTIANTVTVISASYKHTGETIPILSNVGIPDGSVTIEGMTEATQQAYYKTGALPVVGALVDIASQASCTCDTVDVAFEQKGITKATVTGKKLPA